MLYSPNNTPKYIQGDIRYKLTPINSIYMLRKFTAAQLLVVTITLSLLGSVSFAQTNSQETVDKSSILQTLKKTEATVHFIENNGQWDPSVKFAGNSSTGQFIVTNNEIKFVALKPLVTTAPETAEDEVKDKERETHVWGLEFENSNPNCRVATSQAIGATRNYYLGSNRDRYAQGAKSYGDVVMENLYPGIDLRIYSVEAGVMEFDWIVMPGADYSKIKMHYKGQDNITIDEAGKLNVGLRFNTVKFDMPECYQLINGQKTFLNFKFDLVGINEVAFSTKDAVNPAYPLIIDPNLKWGTWFDDNDNAFDAYLFAVDYDKLGNIYCAGYVNNAMSATYIPSANYGYSNTTAPGGLDAILYKLSPKGTSVLAITYFGSTASDVFYGLSMSPYTRDTVPPCFFPTGFSPNGDNNGDLFVIPCAPDYPNSTMVIFNRWGNIVFNSGEGGYKNNFDGTYKGKPLPDGTYFYIFSFNDQDNTRHSSFVVISR